MNRAVHTAPMPDNGRPGWLGGELAPRTLLASVNAGLILYLLVAMITISIAALVFSGPLSVLLPHALGGVLFGTALLLALVSLFGSYGGSIAPTQDTPSVILALGVAIAAKAMPAASPQALLATVLVLVVGTTMACGLVYLLLSVFRLGALVRYLPYPVMGGFLAATGWLLVVGGIGVTTSTPLAATLLSGDELLRWLPALVLGFTMLYAVQRWGRPTLLAGLAALALVLFYATAWLWGLTPAALAADGWLLGPFPDEISWRLPLDGSALAAVDWAAALGALPTVAPAIVIASIALLLNTSALELIVKRDIALDRELLVHGAGNLFVGALGGLIGYTSISLSSLGHTLGHGKRLPGLLVALLLVLTALLGTAAISAIPRVVMAGLLIFIGLALLQEWVLQARRALPAHDYAVVLAIFAVIVLTDFLWGIALGLVVTTVLFLVTYSRVGTVRYALTGASFRSRVARGPREQAVLERDGQRLLIFKLQGYLFFGTANSLFELVRRRLDQQPASATRFVLLDFEHVTGLDSTAMLSFDKLQQLADSSGIEVIGTGMNAVVRRPFDARRRTGQGKLQLFDDIDHGVEWCEERLLREAGLDEQGDAVRLQLQELLGAGAQPDALLGCMTRREIPAGTRLMHLGAPSDELVLIESGRLTAQLERDDGKALRLQSMEAGSIVGELGFLLDLPRSADVVADCDSVVLVLDRPRWNRLLEREPQVARAVETLVIRLLARRVVHLTRVVDTLQR